MADTVYDDEDSVAPGTIVNADINAAAAIDLSKLAGVTASRALVSTAGGVISAATTTATEIGYVNGVTSALQTQLNAKAALVSPSFTTPALGTPSAGVLTNCTGTAAGLTAGTVTTNANLTGPITSTGNATAVAAQTGTGSTFVMQATPTLTTPDIGAATGTSLTTTGSITTTAGVLTATNGLGAPVVVGLGLDVRATTSDGFAASFFCDGNNQFSKGILVQAGADNGSGTTIYFDAFDGDGTETGTLQTTAGTFALVDVSDETLKRDIDSSKIAALDTVNAIGVKEFRYRKQGPTGKLHTAGFTAQNLQEAFPDAVTTLGSGVMGVNKAALIPVLVKAIQELSAQVEELKAKVGN